MFRKTILVSIVNLYNQKLLKLLDEEAAIKIIEKIEKLVQDFLIL